MSDALFALTQRYRRLKTYLKKEEAENYDKLFKRIDELSHENRNIKALLKEAQEFIDDCSVSHVESRYKYRAQILSKKIMKGGE